MLKKVILSVICLLSALNAPAFAEEYVTREQYEQLEKRVLALEEKLSTHEKCINEQKLCMLEQEKKISEYESKLSDFDAQLHRQTGSPISIAEGLEIGAGATMVIQGANNTNNASSDASRKKGRTDASYSTDITLAKEFKDINGKAFLHLENGQGKGLEDDLTLYSNVNRDADDDVNVRVTEIWYEQGLFKDKAVVTFGKLDPTAYFDNNEVANDETTQFLGRIFRNSPALEFPDNSAGIRFAYIPKEWIEFGYGVFDGKSSWEKIGDNLFNIGQITFKPAFFNLPGNYRFYGWNSNVYHTKWLDTDKTKEPAYGFGLSFDQKLNNITTAFLRYGWQNPGVYNPEITATGGLNFSLEHSWSAGLQVEGKPWGREKDMLAFAVGQVFPSSDYRKAGASLDPARRAKAEGHIETYYRIHLNDHLSISPDLQYIWNPFGRDVAGDTAGIFVGGMRAQVDF
ncbi:MAG: carbohydrate porin [Candidatus Omnitrophica bacterium]|nr:carbohydrate porin [Candidatus Omnitrophota bacterium]